MGGSLKRVFQSACLEHVRPLVRHRLTQNAWSHDAEPLMLKLVAARAAQVRA